MIFLRLLVFLIIALVFAGIAEAWIPEHKPGGFGAALLVGLIGAWLGTSLFWRFGPHLVGIALIPAIILSALLVVVFESIYHHRTA
jgi:uncharacterized membrane protein YeaQ/YmgE (transglycosylase-associated protein family)